MADAEPQYVAPPPPVLDAAQVNKKYYFVHVEKDGENPPVATGIIKASGEMPDTNSAENLKNIIGEDCAAKIAKEGEAYVISVPTDGSNYKDANGFNACNAPVVQNGGAKKTRLRKTKSNKNKRNRRKSRRQ